MPGEDTITATVDDVTLSVTKYWLVNFLTGGGTIKDGKKPLWNISGNIGFLPDGSIVGNINIIDHAGKAQYKAHNTFTSLVFSGSTATSPEASFNTATFTGVFTDKGGNEVTLEIVITDNDESGGGADTIEIVGLAGWAADGEIDGGNYQVHNGFK